MILDPFSQNTIWLLTIKHTPSMSHQRQSIPLRVHPLLIPPLPIPKLLSPTWSQQLSHPISNLYSFPSFPSLQWRHCANNIWGYILCELSPRVVAVPASGRFGCTTKPKKSSINCILSTLNIGDSLRIPQVIYTVNHKKRDILFLTITLANHNRFL